MQELSPFRLAPYFRTRIWGFNDLAPWFDFKTEGEPIGEVWLTGEMCEADTGLLKGHALSGIAKQQGAALLGAGHENEEFPLLIKMLFPKEKLSVQVHPDDALAQKFGEPRGKTECWYALNAEPDARVALGIQPGATAERIRAAIEDATLEELLTWLPVAKGDMIYVDAGTVHAIGPGAVLLETQQTSDLTYRMYDYGRPRELHLDKSFEAMRLATGAGKIAPRAENGHSLLIDQKYFRIERWQLSGNGNAEGLTEPHPEVQMLFVAEGAATISGPGFDAFRVERCQLAVIPARSSSWRIEPSPQAEIVRILPQLL